LRFSEILSKVPDLLPTHKLFKRDLGVVGDGEWSYVFRSEEDEARLIHLRVFLFNIYHKKLTAAQNRTRKKAKAEKQKKYMWVFMNGKQVKVKRPATIEGMDPDEYIRQNADPIWLHQNEMWEYIEADENE